MLTLYQRTDCPFCWKVRIALVEYDIAFETVDTVLGEKHPEVKRLSPTGTVPVLVDGELAVWESAVILDYLDARYVPGRLISANPVTQARERLLQAYSDKIVGGCLKEIVFEKRSKPERDWDQEKLREGETRWRECQAWLEAQLAQKMEKMGTDPYFGEGYSAADCALAARFGVAEAYAAGVGEEFPLLRAWYREITGKPGWEKAFPTSFIRTE
jgi:glutathione S-transferase